MREFSNNEMTFRDFSYNKVKDPEMISEHNYSLISNRDIDNIDDMSIVITDDKRTENSHLYNNRITHPFGPDDSFQITKKESNHKISGHVEHNIFFENSQVFSPMKNPYVVSEMDNYLLRKNQVNNIKI
jgi:hypothetical protein